MSDADKTLFPGFESRWVDVGDGVEIACVAGGDAAAPVVLLLHGFPQTHAMYHRIAPVLAETHFVVAADLRGYGDSSKPLSDPTHAPYSKRATGRDQVALMRALGVERFSLVGHDRGARVSHRMALDHPEAVEKVVFLDIIPTYDMYTRLSKAFCAASYQLYFFIQPEPMPETLIGGDPDYFLRYHMGRWPKGRPKFDETAFGEYLRCFRKPETIHAMMEDYRAAASIDLEHDADDVAKGGKVQMPALVLWGAEGFIHRNYDVLAIWRERAANVCGEALPCGHYLPEEQPERTAAAIRAFFAAG